MGSACDSAGVVALRPLIPPVVLAHLVAAVARAEAPAPVAATKVVQEKELLDDDGYRVTLSLPTESDREAWAQPGIRIALGGGYGLQAGFPPAPLAQLVPFMIRASTRIDPRWSVGLEFQFARASTSGLSGLRYTSTLQAILHPWRELGLSFGVGLGGYVLSPQRRMPRAPATAAVTDIVLDGSERLDQCSGSGAAGLARVEYPFVVGRLLSMGPYLDAQLQQTRCTQTIGRQNAETGREILAVQWWTHVGGSAGWWFQWR